MKKTTFLYPLPLLIAFIFGLYASNDPHGSQCFLAQAPKDIMTYEEYASISHSIPYTFELSKNNQHLFYFGANHSCDPHNIQYPLLRSFWDKFIETTKGENCVVLVEGCLRDGNFATPEDAACYDGGEGGYITFFAQQANIPLECPDITPKDLYYKLIEQFPGNYIYYKRFAQNALEFNLCKKNNPELDFTQFYLKRGASKEHLENMLEVHEMLFNAPFNPHDELFFYHITNPVEEKTIINQICRQASILRDQHIVEYIEKLIKQGKHVFVVYGCTHAVMQEKALRTIIEEGKQ